MRKHRFSAFSAIIVLIFFLAACSSSGTKLTTVKSSGGYTGEPFKKMMILAVAKKPENQKLFENVLAAAVDKTGTQAVAGSAVLPAGKKITKEMIIETANKEGIDCVLVTHLVRQGKRKIDVPVSPAGTRTVSTYQGAFYNYYPVAYSYVHYPDQETDQVYVRLKTVFYEVKSQKELWSASSESTDPKSVDLLVRQLSPKVIKSLEDHQLIN